MSQARLSSTGRKIESLSAKGFGKPVNLVAPLIIGGFNVLYPIRIEGFPNVLVRVPCGNQALFPEEKTLADAATTV